MLDSLSEQMIHPIIFSWKYITTTHKTLQVCTQPILINSVQQFNVTELMFAVSKNQKTKTALN